ncbi:MAG TPA: N-acetylmuramoyl-L-alanine amidase, partial [Chthoniobacterales bacterium]
MNAARLSFLLVAAVVCLGFGSTSFAKSKSSAKSSSKSAAKPSASPSPTPNKDWQVIKVGPRDYLSVDNIAKFYGLIGNVDSTGKSVVLNNGRNQLQVTLDSREAIVNGIRNWLCFPVIAHDNKFLVSRIDLAKTIEPQLRPHMIQRSGKIQTIVLDPGHGGYDKGAASSFGNEKDFALDVARKLRPMLQAKGFKVIMTRENDVFIPLEVRARIANATRDSIFVSIHFNATGSNPNATGFEIFSLTPRGAPSTNDDSLALHFVNMQAGSPMEAQSFELAAVVYHSMCGHFLQEFDRGIKRARFAVLRRTQIPAILVEGGFLSESTGDAKRIADPEFRKQLADSICVGL